MDRLLFYSTLESSIVKFSTASDTVESSSGFGVEPRDVPGSGSVPPTAPSEPSSMVSVVDSRPEFSENNVIIL